jgi:hypothetical protein
MRLDRKRKIGGGRDFTLAIEDRLLVTLMYFRLYVSYALLGYLLRFAEYAVPVYGSFRQKYILSTVVVVTDQGIQVNPAPH